MQGSGIVIINQLTEIPGSFILKELDFDLQGLFQQHSS